MIPGHPIHRHSLGDRQLTGRPLLTVHAYIEVTDPRAVSSLLRGLGLTQRQLGQRCVELGGANLPIFS
jgi:hypothetical protein